MTGVEAVSCGRAGHTRAAELVDEQRRLNERLDRFFRHVDETRRLLLEDGSRWEPVMDAPVDAAYQAWRAHGTVGIPLMDIE